MNANQEVKLNNLTTRTESPHNRASEGKGAANIDNDKCSQRVL